MLRQAYTLGKAMENLNILIGSTYEQGFILYGRFFKVYTQSAPEYRALPSDLEKLYVFLRHLAPKLPRRRSGPFYNFDDDVRLYRVISDFHCWQKE